MAFHPFEVSISHIIYALLGGFIVFFGMFSLVLREKLYIGEACWAFIFGVIIGPHGANIFNPHAWGDEKTVNTITLELTRVVLAIGVFAIGVELPKQYMKKHWKSIAFLLVPIMTWGWFVSAGLIYALIPGLNFLSSLAVAACLTPTDPILAAAVIGGKYADKHVPAHIRHLLAAESGCNDGAAFPFLFLALYLIIHQHDTGAAIKDWFLILWLYQIVLGTVIGAVIGFGFRHLMKFGERHDLIDRHSYVAQYVSLALFTLGVTVLLGSDDLLATFACGTAFAWDGFFNRQTEESVFSSVIDLLFNIATFIYLGAWMPFEDFDDPETTVQVWRLIVLAILVLLLRRLPVMIALFKWMPDIKTFREAIFSGHFGPIGVGAIFIATLATEVLEEHHDTATHQTEILTKAMQPIVAFMVLCSITVHGLSIPSFSLGRRVHSVSRTWSRHAPPDWTNQVRRVDEDGPEIVVNRDSAMEKGEAGLDSTLRQPSSSGSVEKEKQKEENLPDGEEVLSEWKEGPWTIIERRAGPGEEVEVEVVRNGDNNSMEELASKFFRGEHGSVMNSLHSFLGSKLHHPASVAEHEAEKLAEGTHHVAEHAEEAVKEKLERPSNEEEGWSSEGTTNGVGSGNVARRLSKKRKARPSVHVVGGGTHPARRRVIQQFRHHHPSASTSPGDSAFDEDDNENRGRPTSTSPSIRDMRLERLRPSRTRESSPARSIRFADAPSPSSGPTSPRAITSVAAASSDPSPAEREDSGDSKNKVTFELRK